MRVEVEGDARAYRLLYRVYCLYPVHKRDAFQTWCEAKKVELATLERERNRNRMHRIPSRNDYAYGIRIDARVSLQSWDPRLWRIQLRGLPRSNRHGSRPASVNQSYDGALLPHSNWSSSKLALSFTASKDPDYTVCSEVSQDTATLHGQTGWPIGALIPASNAENHQQTTPAILGPSATGRLGLGTAYAMDIGPREYQVAPIANLIIDIHHLCRGYGKNRAMLPVGTSIL